MEISNNVPAASAKHLSVHPGGFRARLKDKIKRAISPSPDKRRLSTPPPSVQDSAIASTTVLSATASSSTLSISTASTISIAPTASSSQSIATVGPTPSVSITSSISRTSTAVANITNPAAFLDNPERTAKVAVVDIGQLFETTSQLVYYARLLNLLDQRPSASSTLSLNQKVSNTLHPTIKDREWMDKVKDDLMEKARIRRLVVGLVNEFLLLPYKDTQAIHEIVLLGPVLDGDSYRALLRCFLAEFDKQEILEEKMLQGLVQIVEDAPPAYLEVDNLVKILEIIRVRLGNTASQSDSLLFQLTLALSRVLAVMADQHVKDLDRVKSHQPVKLVLSAFKAADNPFLRFQAMYALQALRCIPDDEKPVQCFFRHVAEVTSDVAQMSRVMQMDFNGFIEGVVEVQKSIKDIYDIAKDGLDDFLALKEDGKNAIQALLGSKELSSWFICLRAAEKFAQSGRLVELSQCINDAPGHNNEYFQWGTCQLLAEIACDSSWDDDTRFQAVDYLGQIHSTTPHQNIKRWIFTLINYISDPKIAHSSIDVDESIKSKATTLVQRFGKYDIDPFPFPNISRRRLALPLSFALLQKVNKIPDIEPRLHAVRSRMRENSLSIYVPLMCKENLQASSINNLQSLEETVSAFLSSQREVLLILGDSGAGKSTFNRHLEHKLWTEYQPSGAIPLFIDLKAMGNLNEIDFIKKKFEQYDLEDSEIREVKRSRQVVLICDGYDECRQLINLHRRLKLDLRWKSLKLMITCRTQYLASMSDRINFEPKENDQDAIPASQLYSETVIVPFKEHQVQVCIDQFRDSPQAIKVFEGQPVWSTEQYLKHLAKLMDLVKNPFMLQIALRTLPKMAKDDGDLARLQMTRFDLYDKFTKQHFDNEKERLSKEILSMDATSKRAFAFLQINFSLHCMGFSKRLAHMVFVENGGINSIEYSTSGVEQGWKDMFFGLEVGEKIKLLQQSSQLISYTANEPSQSNDSNGATIMHQFPHRSILEFLYSCQLCDHWDSTAFSAFFDTAAKYNNLATCLATTADPLQLSKHPLNQQNVILESSVLGFLVDHAKTNLTFQNQLHTILQRSKSDPQVSQAATNAIAILVRAGVRLHNQDFRGIRIRGAQIRQLIVGLVEEFLGLLIKDSQAIHEIVLLGPVLDRDSYRALLRCFLAELDDFIIDLEILQGLAQIIEDAPSEYLEVDYLIKILAVIRVCLETTNWQLKTLTIYLTRVVSRVLSVMVDQKINDLDRVKEHLPVQTTFSGLKVDDHPYLKYQSVYARQALKEVPDNETRGECFFRHFTYVTSSLLKVSRVMQMDWDGFANGVVDARQNLKDIYDLLKDGCDDIKAVKEDGKSTISDLTGTQPWFISLRAAEDFVQMGHLAELSTYINNAPGHGDQNFQWGICQLFGEIATDSSWDAVTRGCSIDHLEQIYLTTLHSNIKRWVMTLLGHISELTNIDGSIKSQVATLTQKLRSDDIQPFDSPCILRRRVPSPTLSELLEAINNTPDLEPPFT